MIEPYERMFDKLPDRTKGEFFKILKQLSQGFNGQIRMNISNNGVIGGTKFLVGEEYLK